MIYAVAVVGAIIVGWVALVHGNAQGPDSFPRNFERPFYGRHSAESRTAFRRQNRDPAQSIMRLSATALAFLAQAIPNGYQPCDLSSGT